jgi:hypothetical protein
VREDTLSIIDHAALLSLKLTGIFSDPSALMKKPGSIMVIVAFVSIFD